MHHIQSHILKKLSLTKKASYSELKPKAVEGNQFSYHLKLLVKEGLIAPHNGMYSLTSKGSQLSDRMTMETFKERIQPKIVTLIVLEQKGKLLLYERNKSPFIGHIGFPYGKIHLEERILDAAHRELADKTGLKANLTHRGDVYITVHNETELVSHMLCHVFTGKNILSTTSNVELPRNCFWSKIEDIARQKLIPGALQIKKLLDKNKKGFFFDEFFLNI